MDSLCMNAGIHGVTSSISANGLIENRSSPSISANGSIENRNNPSISRFSFKYPLKSLFSRGGNGNKYGGLASDDAVLVEDSTMETVAASSEGENGSWVSKILQVRSVWKKEEEKQGSSVSEEEECAFCRVDGDDDDVESEIEFDRDSFSRLLRRVSLPETKMYAQMSYLGNLAYSIPQLKPGNLPKYRGIRVVTSSVEKRGMAPNPEAEHELVESQDPSAAYGIAASSARSILGLKSQKSEAGEEGDVNVRNLEVASLMATTDSVTSVVAAKEEVKQAVANDLNSTLSSPCEWFVCDDNEMGTRFCVIQGSESLASWQANLLFEPVQFEGFDVLVHRGIYEAAKGIYEQMLPEVHAHLEAHGRHATFRFTGHSLGGSLSLLVHLMLLIRGEVPRSSLLPVVMFGAPSIMCGGDHLLDKLGLPRSHVQGIMMHRDIVPRAFSCNYPNHVAELLKAVNVNFRNHPCLNNQKLLYAPMGELLILQPDEQFSPHHHLLPSGSGLYLLTCSLSDTNDAKKLLQAAKTVFFNSPHPLEILSDRSAYGSEGTIMRDHDMRSYLKSVRTVIRHELNQIRKFNREHSCKIWWPLVSPRSLDAGRPGSISIGQDDFNFAGVLQTGRQSLKRFSRLIASQQMHLLVVLLFPAKLLFLGA